MSLSQPPVKMTLKGRRVTLSFDLPFLPGDDCISPYNLGRTKVSTIPEGIVRIGSKAEGASVGFYNCWYTTDHTQIAGADYYLKDDAALLDFWLNQPLEDLEPRLSSLEHFFAKNDVAIKNLRAKVVELAQKEVEAARVKMGELCVFTIESIKKAEERVARLEVGS